MDDTMDHSMDDKMDDSMDDKMDDSMDDKMDDSMEDNVEDMVGQAVMMPLEEFNKMKEEYRNTLETRIVLVGKTGVGKSQTGNTILGVKVFEAKLQAKSVTKTCKSHVVNVDGKFIKVVDVPGFIDTEMTEVEEKTAILQCVIEACPGIHAFVMIIRIGRFTNEDKLTLKRFIDYFGEGAMGLVMVVFTGLDELERNGDTFENFITNATDDLISFLNSIDNRYIAVNNYSNINSKFVEDLLSIIKGMVDKNNGQFLTNEMLQQTNDQVRKEEEKHLQKMIHEQKVNLLNKLENLKREMIMKLISEQINENKRQMSAWVNTSLALMCTTAGAATGAIVGVVFGPVGALVGGAVGGAVVGWWLVLCERYLKIDSIIHSTFKNNFVLFK